MFRQVSLASHNLCGRLLSRPAQTSALGAMRHLRTTPSVFGGHGLSQHRDTDDNNLDTPFEFTEENYKKIDEIIAKYPENYQQSAVMPLLTLAQNQHGGWLPLAAMKKIAKILKIDEIEVYEVATFYSMYKRTKVGKYHLELCTTTPCQLGGVGSTLILDTIKEHLGIDVGETTSDGLFTLGEVECLGACVNAPMMQIGDYYYEDLTVETTIELLDKLKRGEEVKPGPQGPNARKNSIPAGGRTTLFDKPTGPYAPHLDKEVESAK